MRKKPMNFRLILALDGLALLAIIGAVQAVRWACSWLAVALAYWGGWDIAEATYAAPWIIVASTSGLKYIFEQERIDRAEVDCLPPLRRYCKKTKREQEYER